MKDGYGISKDGYGIGKEGCDLKEGWDGLQLEGCNI